MQKTFLYLITIVTAMLFTSCTVSNYYQMVKITPVADMSVIPYYTMYEDDNCKILYDFWNSGGDSGFIFQNNTDKPIYINKKECFFVLNGSANNYYKNRIYTESVNSVTSVSSKLTNTSSLNSVNNEITTIEEEIICIPPNTSKVLSEYVISASPYRNCDLLRYPKKSEPSIVKFDANNSPFRFSNIITYKVGNEGVYKTIENSFYASEIANYEISDVMAYQYDQYCGEKSYSMVKTFKNVSHDTFYIYYQKSSTSFQH